MITCDICLGLCDPDYGCFIDDMDPHWKAFPHIHHVCKTCDDKLDYIRSKVEDDFRPLLNRELETRIRAYGALAKRARINLERRKKLAAAKARKAGSGQ